MADEMKYARDPSWGLAMIVARHQGGVPPIIMPDHQLGVGYLEIGKDVEAQTGTPVLLDLNDGAASKFSQLVAAYQQGQTRLQNAG